MIMNIGLLFIAIVLFVFHAVAVDHDQYAQPASAVGVDRANSFNRSCSSHSAMRLGRVESTAAAVNAAYSFGVMEGRQSENDDRQNETDSGGFIEKQPHQQQWQMIVHSADALFHDHQKLLEEKQKEIAKRILQEMCLNLHTIRQNIPRPKGVKEFFKRFINAQKTKKIEKKLAKNPQLEMEIRDTVLDESSGGPCEMLLPTSDKKTGKLHNDYELRLKVRENLDDLTGWALVKEAICSSMKSHEQLKRCNRIAEKLDFIEEEGEEETADHWEDDDGMSSKHANVNDQTQSPIWDEEINLRDQKNKNKEKKGLNKLWFRGKKNEKKSSEEKELNVSKNDTKKADIELLIEARRALERKSQLHDPIVKEKPNLIKQSFLPRSVSSSMKDLSTVSSWSHSFRRSDSTASSSRKKSLQKGHGSLRMQTAEWSSPNETRNPLLRSATARYSDQSLVKRSSSIESNLFARNTKENILCTVRMEIVHHGMQSLNDDYMKERVLKGFRRVNCILQLVILEQKLQDTRYYDFINAYNLKDCEKIVKIRQIMLLQYKQTFLKEKESLNLMIKRLVRDQLGAEFAKALAELCDKVITHWSWLYEQLTIAEWF